jgi:hypothetical protein
VVSSLSRGVPRFSPCNGNPERDRDETEGLDKGLLAWPMFVGAEGGSIAEQGSGGDLLRISTIRVHIALLMHGEIEH